jgi:hypothetical protein
MIKVFLLLFITFFFTNCSTKNLSPINVSDYFWEAQQEAKLDDAKKFVREKDKKNVALQSNIKIRKFTFLDAKVEGDIAIVPTKMYLQSIISKDKKDQIEVDFDTQLEKTKDGWKVNLAKTKEALYLETAKKFSKGLGAEILQKLQEKMGDFKKFQGVLVEMVDGMKKSLQK